LNEEENRVYYVALSRAMESLFINVPKLFDENKHKVEAMGFNVIKLEESEI
jgi:superfamily I DNA/RNA helicase